MTDEAFEVMYCPNTHDFSRAFVRTVLVLLFVVAYFSVAQERQVWEERQVWVRQRGFLPGWNLRPESVHLVDLPEWESRYSFGVEIYLEEAV